VLLLLVRVVGFHFFFFFFREIEKGIVRFFFIFLELNIFF
jgi:hypothetical protein